jgi:ferredoxin
VPKVTFLNELITVDAKAGQTLRDVAEKTGINLFRGLFQGVHCSGNQGWCNRCKVWATPLAEGALNPRTRKEKRGFRLNGKLPPNGNMRLACQTVVSGDCEVRTRPGYVQMRPQSLAWDADPRPSKWRDRWDNRKQAGAAAEADDEEEAAE